MINLTKTHNTFASVEAALGMTDGALLAGIHKLGEELCGQVMAGDDVLTCEDLRALAESVIDMEFEMYRLNSAECREVAVASFLAGYTATVA